MTHDSPAIRWFEQHGWTPLDFQREVWSAYLRGESGLVHAATGTGKTLAAWWGPLLEWIADSGHTTPTDGVPRRVKRTAAPPLRVGPVGFRDGGSHQLLGRACQS